MSLDAEDIRNEKVKVLRSMEKVEVGDVVMGQYRRRYVSVGWLQSVKLVMVVRVFRVLGFLGFVGVGATVVLQGYGQLFTLDVHHVA